SSSKLSRDQTSNPTSYTNPTPKGRIHRSLKQKVENSNFEEHLPPVATMADNHTMAEMLRAPTEGCAEAIVVPPILAEQFELKHCLINMMTSEQFFGLETDNPHDHIYQDSLNAAACGNLLEKSPQNALTIIENKSKVRNSRSKPIASPVKACDINSSSEIAKLTHAVHQQTSDVTTAMTAILKQLQATPPPAPVKAVEEICVTCGGAHPYYQCLAAGGNTFPEFRDNIQGFAQPNVQNNQNRFGQPQGFNRGTNFNQEQPYQATTQSNQNFHLNELEKIKRMNDVSLKSMQNQIDMVKNELRNEMKTSIQTSLSNQTNEIKNMMASLLQMNTASTSRSGSLPGNTVANPKGELKAITTRSGLVTDGPTVPTPLKSVTPEEDECVEETYTNPDLAEYTIKVPPLPVQKPKPPVQRNFVLHTRDSPLLNISSHAKIPENAQSSPSNKDKLQELANTPLNENCSAVILKKLPEKLRDAGKFLIPCGFTDFVVVDYESDPRVPLILGRPFLRVAHALIDIHGEEMILRDGDERLTLNMKHDTTSYSNHPHRESANLINIFNVSSEDCLEVSVSNQQSGNPTFSFHKEIASPEVTHEIHDSEGCKFLSEEFPDIDSFNDIHPHFDDNPLSDSTTYSSNSLLEEFTDELALITYPLDYDDNLQCDIESNLREIEFLLDQGKDSDLKDSIDQTDLANLANYFVDPIPEMFNDEHAPDYSFPLRFDVYDDDFLEVESNVDNFYDDPFDSKGEKIKESKLLIDELDLPCVFFLIQNKKLATSKASLVFEDFDPPFYEPFVFKDVPNSMRLLPFSSENEEKVFKPGIYTSEKKFKEDLFTYYIKNRILQDSSEPSNDNTNVVNALREPFVVNQDPGKNSSQSPPQINHHCYYRCGDSLQDIFCHQCTCELCGKGAHYGYNYPPKVLIIPDPEPFNNQTVDELPQTLPSFDPTRYFEDGNSFTYDSKSNLVHDSPNVFDPPSQPPLYSCEFCGNDARYGHYCTPQVPFIYPEPCYNQDFKFPQYIQKKEEEKQIEKEQAAKVRYWKIPVCYDDDDEDYTIAITHKEPDNSLRMGDDHLDTISTTESDEFIKSSVENLVPNPSESEGEYECDVPACEDFTTFSNILFDANYDFYSSDDKSFYDEDILMEIYSDPLFDEEIISMNIDPHHFNAESDLIESLLNRDSLIISSSLKIDSLFDEFAGELTLLKSIPPGIKETDILRKKFVLSRDCCMISHLLMTQCRLALRKITMTLKGIFSSLKNCLTMILFYFLKNESFNFDIPSSSRPPAKPLDGITGFLNVKVMGDISEHKVPMPRFMITQPTLVPNQEKSPNLLSHLGHEAFHPSAECPMMIYGRNTPILDVSFFYFYPP
nr:hypothetical protein [Tanacetum cinerariifolium]